MATLLLIGPTLSNKERDIGGATISFELFLRHVRNDHQTHQTISINFSSNKWLNAAALLLKALWQIPQCDVVMLNVNPRGALYIAPIIYRYSLLWRKKYVFHMFGGDLTEIYEDRSPRGKKEIQKSIFGAHAVYLQTRQLINFFQPYSNDIRWLPTSRAIDKNVRLKPFEGKFVFISQIKKTKGIDFIIQLAENRPELDIAVYGPILEPQYENLVTKKFYHGTVDPEKIADVLTTHDVLLLPTFHPGEGYPGIIIEAFAAGLPVIATNWLAIPDLVLEGKTGYLVAPHSFESLEHAIDRMTPENHALMSRQVLDFVRQFDRDKINTRVLEELIAISGVKQ